MKILHVVGARPNFMKLAPIKKRMDLFPDKFRQTVLHTGQHYDDNMSKAFFTDLALPEPDINLNAGSGSHARQVAEVMLRLEDRVLALQPDLVIVVGDVNATLAAALVCSKLGIKIAHVEAGLRSFDRSMPEEINRLLTDQVADLLFTPSRDGGENLAREGVARDKIHFVGNVMIDTLLAFKPSALARAGALLARLGLERYALVTLHRPSNVDQPEQLTTLMRELARLSETTPLVFPMHPRTRARIDDEGLADLLARSRITVLEPQAYIDFLALQTRAQFILTDSGGVQEESTFLGIPCLTLRANTERPITITHGTNVLLGQNADKLAERAAEALTEIANRRTEPPPLWDGRAAERIVEIIGRTGS